MHSPALVTPSPPGSGAWGSGPLQRFSLPMDRAVANRYVSALAEVVVRDDVPLSPEDALGQLEEFASLLAAAPDLAVALTSPAVQVADKRGLIRDIGERAGLDRLVVNFLCVVADQRRMRHFPLLVERFRAWLDRHIGRVALKVRLARPVGEAQRVALEARFRALTGSQVRVAYVHDPDIIGGCSVQVGSRVYDGSLRTALTSLADMLVDSGR